MRTNILKHPVFLFLSNREVIRVTYQDSGGMADQQDLIVTCTNMKPLLLN